VFQVIKTNFDPFLFLFLFYFCQNFQMTFSGRQIPPLILVVITLIGCVVYAQYGQYYYGGYYQQQPQQQFQQQPQQFQQLQHNPQHPQHGFQTFRSPPFFPTRDNVDPVVMHYLDPALVPMMTIQQTLEPNRVIDADKHTTTTTTVVVVDEYDLAVTPVILERVDKNEVYKMDEHGNSELTSMQSLLLNNGNPAHEPAKYNPNVLTVLETMPLLASEIKSANSDGKALANTDPNEVVGVNINPYQINHNPDNIIAAGATASVIHSESVIIVEQQRNDQDGSVTTTSTSSTHVVDPAADQIDPLSTIDPKDGKVQGIEVLQTISLGEPEISLTRVDKKEDRDELSKLILAQNKHHEEEYNALINPSKVTDPNSKLYHEPIDPGLARILTASSSIITEPLQVLDILGNIEEPDQIKPVNTNRGMTTLQLNTGNTGNTGNNTPTSTPTTSDTNKSLHQILSQKYPNAVALDDRLTLYWSTKNVKPVPCNQFSIDVHPYPSCHGSNTPENCVVPNGNVDFLLVGTPSAYIALGVTAEPMTMIGSDAVFGFIPDLAKTMSQLSPTGSSTRLNIETSLHHLPSKRLPLILEGLRPLDEFYIENFGSFLDYVPIQPNQQQKEWRMFTAFSRPVNIKLTRPTKDFPELLPDTGCLTPNKIDPNHSFYVDGDIVINYDVSLIWALGDPISIPAPPQSLQLNTANQINQNSSSQFFNLMELTPKITPEYYSQRITPFKTSPVFKRHGKRGAVDAKIVAEALVPRANGVGSNPRH
jgi:hypothetical protein